MFIYFNKLQYILLRIVVVLQFFCVAFVHFNVTNAKIRHLDNI